MSRNVRTTAGASLGLLFSAVIVECDLITPASKAIVVRHVGGHKRHGHAITLFDAGFPARSSHGRRWRANPTLSAEPVPAVHLRGRPWQCDNTSYAKTTFISPDSPRGRHFPHRPRRGAADPGVHYTTISCRGASSRGQDANASRGEEARDRFRRQNARDAHADDAETKGQLRHRHERRKADGQGLERTRRGH